MIYRFTLLEDPGNVLTKLKSVSGEENAEFFCSIKSKECYMEEGTRNLFAQLGIKYKTVEVIDPEEVPLYYTRKVMEELKPIENSIKAKVLASGGIAAICAHYADDDFLEQDMIFNHNKYLYVDSPQGKKTYLWRVVSDRAEAKEILINYFNRDEKVLAWMQWVYEMEKSYF